MLLRLFSMLPSTGSGLSGSNQKLALKQSANDFATVQTGNSVTKSLANYKDLGIHTEMLTSSVVDLYEAGAITNTEKNIHRYKTVYTLCWGMKKLYDFIDDNPYVESCPSSHMNYP